jgi:acetylornithine aminotransferase
MRRSNEYLLPVYLRPPFVLSHGKGLKIWDTEGREYLDFSAGIAVNALGHADEELAEVMATEAKKILHASNVYHNEWAGKLAELLITLTQREGGLGYAAGTFSPPGIDAHTNADVAVDGTSASNSSPAPSTTIPGAKIFFSNSGTEANEGALKIARKVGKDRGGAQKHAIVCFRNAFHGRSMGALSVTPNEKYQAPFTPLIPGVRVGNLNDLAELEGSLVGPDTCAVIVEPVQGEGGCTAAQVEWLRTLRRKCDEHGAVLIFDEVQCGLYRTGTIWAHSPLPVDCHPDIVTMAKPLANGYPIGAVLLRDSVAKTMTPGTHGTTFGGSPLACALGHHVLSRLSARPFVANIAAASAHLDARLSRLTAWFPRVLEPDVRGRGLIRGLAFVDTAGPARLVELARERGVLLLTAGHDAVRFVPSLTVSVEEINQAMEVVESCLAIIDGERR